MSDEHHPELKNKCRCEGCCQMISEMHRLASWKGKVYDHDTGTIQDKKEN